MGMDRSGLLVLPPLLREYAQFDQTLMLVGQGNKFELWGQAQWEAARSVWLSAGLQDESGVIPEELNSLSL